MSSMGDPSYGVNRDLLPHVHLISTYRYIQKAQVEIPEVTSWLMQAPQIARDKAPFFWTYLDRPENGTVTLTWQPLGQMGTIFASDGYIWPPQEEFFTQEIGNGVILEMYLHKAGYAFGDQFATHSRRRFRLCPPHTHNPNAPQVDPSLWIVHYGPVDGNQRIPAQVLMRDPRTQSILEARAYLQRCGQIQRKEFILGDRVNWPQIAWPREPSRQTMYAGNRGVPQTLAYPPHPPAAGAPPAKRARGSQASHNQVQPAMGAIHPPELDDDEDTSRGDMFDHLTPRELSFHRYRQNHEWMEEILSSPYRMSQIGFTSLGLGLKGPLASLTEGIFEAQGADVLSRPPSKPVTHLDAEQALEFKKRIDQHIESSNAEIEKLKAEHEKKMAKFQKHSVLATAEKQLRDAFDGSSPDALQLEGQNEESEDGTTQRWSSKHSKNVEDIVSQVEAQLGRRAEVIYDLKRIQDGGYQEPAPEPVSAAAPPPVAGDGVGGGLAAFSGSGNMSRQPSLTGSHASGMVGDSDMDMGGTAGSMLDQMHTGMSSTSTPGNNFPTPQGPLSAIQSSVATPANHHVPTPPPAAQQGPQPPKPAGGEDINMTGTGEESSATAPDHGTGSGDWVVIPKGGVTPDPAAANASSAPESAKALEAAGSKQASTTGTPPVGDNSSMGFDNDFGSLGDLDTAGEALANFSDTPGDLGGDFMDDSAFGDAFHGVEAGNADTPADGNL